MYWHSDRWRTANMGPAPWPALERIVHCDWRDAAETGFTISPKGIHLLEPYN